MWESGLKGVKEERKRERGRTSESIHPHRVDGVVYEGRIGDEDPHQFPDNHITRIGAHVGRESS